MNEIYGEELTRAGEPALTDFSRERMRWSIFPSYRSLIPWLVVAVLLTGFGLATHDQVLEKMVVQTWGFIGWDERGVTLLDRTLRVFELLPLAYMGLRLLILRLTNYELSDRRLLIHHGLILRRHDEIALHRIRDYVVKRTLLGMILGYGSVRLVTRDPSMASILIRNIATPRERSEDIRDAAYLWKTHIGYREFDTGPLN